MEAKNAAWLEFSEFIKLSALEEQKVKEMIENGSIASKEEDGQSSSKHKAAQMH